MIKIKALKNCGCIDSFRSIKTNQEIERSMEKITEGVIRLWKKDLLTLDGKAYFPDNPYEKNIGKIVTTGRQIEIPAVPKKVDVEAPEGQSIDKPVDPEPEPETAAEEGEKKDGAEDEAQEEKTEEAAPPVADEPVAPEPTPAPAEEPVPPVADEPTAPVEEPVQAPVDETPDQKDADKDVIEAGEAGEESTNYVLEQEAGFFSKDKLNGHNVDELKPIGYKLGIEIKTRKKGVSDIMDKVKSILEK